MINKNNEGKFISIIVPTFNSTEYLEATLNSVLNQTSANWECIMVDDGSTDNTSQIAQNFISRDQRFQFYERDRLPKNANTCRNIGASKAKSEYIMFLDSDDLLTERCVEDRLKNMDDDTDLLIHGSSYFFEDGEIKAIGKRVKSDHYLRYFLRLEYPWQICSPTWNKDFFKKVGGFNENYNRLQDPEMHIRALNHQGVTVKYKPEFNDTLYRKINSRLDKSNLQFYDKIINSFNQIVNDNIERFKGTSYEKDLLSGIAIIISNIFYWSKIFKLDNQNTMKMIFTLEENSMISKKHIGTIEKILFLDRKFFNQRFLKIRQRILRIVLKNILV